MAVTWGRAQRLHLGLYDAESIPSPRQQASLSKWAPQQNTRGLALLAVFCLRVCFSFVLLHALLGEMPCYPEKRKDSHDSGMRLPPLRSIWKEAPAWGRGLNSTRIMLLSPCN